MPLTCAVAAHALRTMKHLVDASLARDGTLNGVDPARMLQAKHAFRSATRLHMKATAARATNLEKGHSPLARRRTMTTAKHGTGLMNALTQLAYGHPLAARHDLIWVRLVLKGTSKPATGLASLRRYGRVL